MDRLVEIETKLAFQEDAIHCLNDEICRQQKRIDQLEATARLLIDRLRQLSQGIESAATPADEKPPHY